MLKSNKEVTLKTREENLFPLQKKNQKLKIAKSVFRNFFENFLFSR